MAAKHVFTLVILIQMLVCQTGQPPDDKKITSIRDEISKTIDIVFEDSVNIDLDKALKPLWNSPDFVFLNNGKIYSYTQLMEDYTFMI